MKSKGQQTKEWYEACIKAQAERIRKLEKEVRELKSVVHLQQVLIDEKEIK